MSNDSIIDNDCFLDLKALSARSCLSVRTLRGYIGQGRPGRLASYLVGGKRLIRWCDFLSWAEQFRQEPNSDVDQILNEVVNAVL